MEHQASSTSTGSNPSSSHAPAHGNDDDVIDIDVRELTELYRRIPPPELRSYEVNTAKQMIISTVARTAKADGYFDNFRKAWLKDLETRPQFQNLIRRIEIRCSEYLTKIKWTPDINKTSVREKLQNYIGGLSFVETGIRDLLQEITSGIYANPIPYQHFDEAVQHILSDCVQQYVFGGTPPFPRLRKSQEDEQPPAPAPPPPPPVFQQEPEPHLPERPPSSLQNDPSENRRRVSLSKSPSIETVDMDISDPDSGEEERSKSRNSVGRAEDLKDVENSVDGEEKKDDRDIQGALGLLMLASGNDWTDFAERASGMAEEQQKDADQVDSGQEKHELIPEASAETEDKTSVMGNEENQEESASANMYLEPAAVKEGEDVESDWVVVQVEHLHGRRSVAELETDRRQSLPRDSVDKTKQEQTATEISNPHLEPLESESENHSECPPAAGVIERTSTEKEDDQHPVLQNHEMDASSSVVFPKVAESSSLSQPANQYLSSFEEVSGVDETASDRKDTADSLSYVTNPSGVSVELSSVAVSEPGSKDGSRHSSQEPPTREASEPSDGIETGSASEPSSRPTRQRKSNSKYCNDAFVTVTSSVKRGAKRSRAGTASGIVEEANSPASSNEAAGKAEEKGSTKKRRKSKA